jgi:GNAT superfamily N-acetyltransferase
MSSEIRYENIVPPAQDYNRLRRDAGWPQMDPDTAACCLPESQYLVCAFDGDEMVGTGRVVGDGGLCFYIQDVIVLKSHQGLGIGAGLMERIMAFIAGRAVKDTYVGLMSAVGKEAFYERYGFTVRPTNEFGAGMTRMWKLG